MYRAKALALLSGGLDSMLSALLIKEQGVYVKGIHFYTGFCITEHKRRLGLSNKANPAIKSASQIGVPIEIIDISKEYLKVVLNPKFGYGKNVNPCIDCRILMLKKAKEIMQKEGYDFIITGEVVYQRPMSQTPSRLKLIEREAGLEGLILRPLSAKVLPPTIPEMKGLVDREKLLGIRGRGRKVQIELAKRYNLEYEQPAGGCCYLTDENYAFRFKEVFSFEGRVDEDDLHLFMVGRHVRLKGGTRVIMARSLGEKNYLMGFKGRFDHALKEDHPFAFALLRNTKEEDLKEVANLMCRYYGKREGKVKINFKGKTLELFGHPQPKEYKLLVKSGG